MTKQQKLEKQVEQLIEQVNTLTLRVFALEQNASLLSANSDPTPEPAKTLAREQQEKSLKLTGNSLLPRVASVCFLLVIALILRTMTDSGVINLQFGSLLGMAYAAGLILTSWILYKRSNALAPVFNCCGAILMFTVTLEVHTHFEAFPQEVAYSAFAITGIALGAISYGYRVTSPILIGTLGMCLAGTALNFPNPFFPYLSILLWLANILGFFASRIEHCSWLRWAVLGITLTMLQVWGLRVELAPMRGDQLAPLSPGWLLPMASLICLTYLSISLIGIIRSGERRISKFDFSLPTVTACYGFLVGLYILNGSTAFTLTVAIAALGHLGIAYLLSRRQIISAPGTNSFTLASVILLSFSLPILFNNLLFSTAILSALAYYIARLSVTWGSGGMRFTSYLLQTHIGVISLIKLLSHTPGSQVSIAIFSAATCTIFAIAQFRFCRANKPPEHSLAFSRYDTGDWSGASVLLSGLASGFTLTMYSAISLLQSLWGPQGLHAYPSIQTVTINCAAIGLMALAFKSKNHELQYVAILVMLVGGAKTFLIDLLNISGIGLIVGIFSFGISVSYVSFVLSRWPKDIGPPQNEPTQEESHNLATQA